MTRKKTSLRKYARRRKADADISSQENQRKRQVDASQFKPRPFKTQCSLKSPFKSVLQKSHFSAVKKSTQTFRTKVSPIKKQTVLSSPLKAPLCRPASSSYTVNRFKRSRMLFGAETSPMKRMQSLKSPLKSPMFNPTSTSPALKRFKPARNLFKHTTQKAHVKQPPCLPEDDVSTETCSVTDENEDFGLEALPDDAAGETVNCVIDQSVDTDAGYQSENTNAAKIIELVPSVMEELAKYDGIDTAFVNFFQLVKNKQFPLNNTAFMLWMDVVKWFSCSSTTEMRYTDKTKLFWKLGWRIFGKRFVNFMGGFKSHGETVLKMAASGNYSPASSEINFAVPDLNVLREFDPYEAGTECKPGIFNDTIDEMSRSLNEKSACITFDGKKLKQGLTEDSGDVDLLGFEKGSTLQDRHHMLEMEMNEIKLLIQTIDDLEKQCQENSTRNTTYAKEILNTDDIKQPLLKHLSRIADHEGELEKLRSKKEYCKKRLIENSGPDWRKGKYVYAISAVTAYMHEIDSYMTMARNVSERICRLIAYLNNEQYLEGRTINLKEDERYVSIDDFKSDMCDDDANCTRLICQRSEDWHHVRNQAKVTGSTLYKSIGCDGLGRQTEHFEKVICGVPEKEPSKEIKAMMDWGTNNEINAVATAVGKILPVLEPGLKFYEEGCCTVERENGDIFMVVSPDGSLRTSRQMNTTEVAIEIKCPTRNVHTEFPARYYLQCQSEMITLNVPRMLYISWTEEDTTVFTLTRDDLLFNASMKIAVDKYGVPKPKKANRLTDDSKTLKNEMAEKAKNVHIAGRFTSCKQSEVHVNEYDKTESTFQDVKQLLEDIRYCYKERYELLREKATEAVVFLLADLDRSWKRESIRCSPIAWFPKGYSLNCEIMRSIAEEVHTRCTSSGVHVPCESFDGQWHVLVVRSASGEPLTVYQLQKDVWRQVEKTSKGSILAELKTLNRNVIVLNVETDNAEANESPNKHRIATNGAKLRKTGNANIKCLNQDTV